MLKVLIARCVLVRLFSHTLVLPSYESSVRSSVAIVAEGGAAVSLERIVPQFLMPYYRQTRSRVKNHLFGSSNQRVFARIYRESLWGDALVAQKYYSGDGSHDPSVADYAALVRRIIAESGVKSVLEIGCGDFAVASLYAQDCKRYTGVDVVPELIAYNRIAFGTDTIDFLLADATEREMPKADLCLVRQVFQHLSNRDIGNILRNTRRSSLLLVTEHLPAPDLLRRPNIDKSACPDIRVTFGSGVYLDQPPFNRKIEVLLDFAIQAYNIAPGERLRTVLIRNDNKS